VGMAVSVPHYTVSDLDRFPDDGNRYELLDGVLLVTPAPNVAHQAIATRLAYALQNAHAAGEATVFGPGVVTRPPGTQLEPDLLVVPRVARLRQNWSELKEHWLAVEIYSPSSRIYDRDFKRDAYLALGVREVWLVDAEERSVDITGADGRRDVARESIAWAVGDTGSVITVELGEIFAGL
jgi:Uma2 family endonuclease